MRSQMGVQKWGPPSVGTKGSHKGFPKGGPKEGATKGVPHWWSLKGCITGVPPSAVHQGDSAKMGPTGGTKWGHQGAAPSGSKWGTPRRSPKRGCQMGSTKRVLQWLFEKVGPPIVVPQGGPQNRCQQRGAKHWGYNKRGFTRGSQKVHMGGSTTGSNSAAPKWGRPRRDPPGESTKSVFHGCPPGGVPEEGPLV
jgi:hypothetical protein